MNTCYEEYIGHTKFSDKTQEFKHFTFFLRSLFGNKF